MEESGRVRLVNWSELPEEELSERIGRRMVWGERAMIAQLRLEKGAVVPLHSHDNEQLTYVVQGALRFLLGEDEDREVVVRSGEVLVIPSGLPHSAEALEDTLDVDVFSPPRQDWLDGTDDYLRRGG